MTKKLSLIFGFCVTSILQLVYSQESSTSADASFNYISSTLQSFHGSGRLANNPGIDGADLEHFIALLDNYYQAFSRGFSAESAMCRFYRDPENGRMTIEEKAELSFSFLRDLDDRLVQYQQVDVDFQEAVENQFGSILLENINSIKVDSVSNQWLPSSLFDEAATINFLDAMCR